MDGVTVTDAFLALLRKLHSCGSTPMAIDDEALTNWQACLPYLSNGDFCSEEEEPDCAVSFMHGVLTVMNGK
jgi:hypothetical protein